MKKLDLKVIDSKSYKTVVKSIKDRVYQAQYDALKVVNKELVSMNLDIGKIISEKLEIENWGDSVVETIGADLRSEFPGMRGFARANIFNMLSLYQAYKDNVKVQPLVGQIGWTHNLIIIEKCKNELEREFYIRLTIKEGLTKRLLQQKIKDNEYERWATSQDNFDETLPVEIATEAQVAFKDDYNLDILLLREKHSERDLEEAITKNIITFLEEMGSGFAFIGRQFRIELAGDEYFIDLLFYQRNLKCLVAIDLKIGKYKGEYMGQMATYLAGLDKYERQGGENPSIGLIVCQKKNRELVDLTLQYIAKPIGVATYEHYDNKKKLPKGIGKYLPTNRVIEKRLLSVNKRLSEQ